MQYTHIPKRFCLLRTNQKNKFKAPQNRYIFLQSFRNISAKFKVLLGRNFASQPEPSGGPAGPPGAGVRAGAHPQGRGGRRPAAGHPARPRPYSRWWGPAGAAGGEAAAASRQLNLLEFRQGTFAGRMAFSLGVIPGAVCISAGMTPSLHDLC